MANLRNIRSVCFLMLPLLFFWLLIFIAPGLIFADSLVTQEILDEIERKCLEAYPGEFLIKFVMDGEVMTEKGVFEPSELEDLVEPFRIFLKPGLKFIDLGSGDGRIVFLASLFGVEATGIEWDSTLYQISIDAMRNLSDIINTKKIRLIKGDFLRHDFQGYDVFYCFEGTNDLPELEEKLSEEMKSGSILISCDNEMPIDKVNLIQEFSSDVKIYVYQELLNQ